MDHFPLWVTRYIARLKEELDRVILVKEVCLFGSYATGAWKKGSDLDIAVISDDFSSMTDIERIIFLSKISRSVPLPRLIDIDVVGFTPREIERAGYFDLAGMIRDCGKKVA